MIPTSPPFPLSLTLCLCVSAFRPSLSVCMSVVLLSASLSLFFLPIFLCFVRNLDFFWLRWDTMSAEEYISKLVSLGRIPAEQRETRTHIHTHTRAHLHTYIHTYIYIYVYICMYTHTHTCSHTYICTHIHIYTHMCAYTNFKVGVIQKETLTLSR